MQSLVSPFSNPNKHTDEKLLNEQQAAEYLEFTPRALQMWRHKGNGPKYVKISSRAVRYRKRDLDEWIEAHVRTSTSGNESFSN